MIRTPRSAAFALLAAAALVSIPGTAFADASAAGHDAGPGFNNGIIINQTYQHIDGNVYNADDDGIVDGLPGAGAPFVQFRLSNRSPFALERTSQQGAEYPRFLLAGSLAFVQTTDPSTADYQSAGAPGTRCTSTRPIRRTSGAAAPAACSAESSSTAAAWTWSSPDRSQSARVAGDSNGGFSRAYSFRCALWWASRAA